MQCRLKRRQGNTPVQISKVRSDHPWRRRLRRWGRSTSRHSSDHRTFARPGSRFLHRQTRSQRRTHGSNKRGRCCNIPDRNTGVRLRGNIPDRIGIPPRPGRDQWWSWMEPASLWSRWSAVVAEKWSGECSGSERRWQWCGGWRPHRSQRPASP